MLIEKAKATSGEGYTGTENSEAGIVTAALGTVGLSDILPTETDAMIQSGAKVAVGFFAGKAYLRSRATASGISLKSPSNG
jgi:hypothetical protein